MSDYGHSSLITINEQSGYNLENYQILVELDSANFNFEDAQFNGKDIRFTLDDHVTLIDYWIEKWDNINEIGKIWVKVPSIPASETEVLYMYYCNPSVSSASNGDNTFEFFDDAKTGLATDKWESIVGTPDFEYSGGFEGIWYQIAGAYHGAMATYTAKHRPMAIRAEAQNKTFFVYGGEGAEALISYYCHNTQEFAMPVSLGSYLNHDAHRNPTLLIDEDGYLYVFYGSHYDNTIVKKSINIYDISSWESKAEVVGGTTYPQPWQLKNGEIIVFYRIQSPRAEVYRKSTDGTTTWSDETVIIDYDNESFAPYIISIAGDESPTKTIHLAWNYRDWSASNKRFNTYYMYSDDGGSIWKNINGTILTLPINEESDVLVYDSGSDNCWMKDIQLDSNGNPYILFLVGAGIDLGNYQWKVARWNGVAWEVYNITTSDQGYDTGALVIFSDNDFRTYLPSIATQPNEDGGDIEEWQSIDRGETWSKISDITSGSAYSHNYIRTVLNSNGDFRIFWSYGDSTPDAVNKKVSLYFWGENQGSAQIISTPTRYLRLSNSIAEDAIIRAKNINLSNFIVEAQILPIGMNKTHSLLCARITDAGYHYNVRAYHGISGNSRVYKYIDSKILLAEGEARDITTWKKWTIKIKNHDISFLVDDELLIDTTDSEGSISSGSIGGRVHNSSLKMDDIRIRKYTSPEPLISIT